MFDEATHAYPDAEARRHVESLIATVCEAGALAKARFDSDLRLDDKAHGDIVTDVDLACETIIIAGIRALAPTHHIHSEEAGVLDGASDWSWIVDPLDGTHNYVSGIPLFGMIVSLCFRGEPVAAILHDAHREETVHGTRHGPVFLNGAPLPALSPEKPLRSATIGWTQGYAVGDDPTARRVRDRVEANAKRLMATWSPVIETMKVLTGKFGGMVSYDGEFTDLSAARALVPALGGKVARFSRGGEDRRFVVGAAPYVDALLAEIGAVMSD
ncbi:inositol monophosphatase [Salinarimonas sp.]|uniref:inositol monophosphatase family protein n=1 Tax=Salinarimonas sp. TaxID=2766526 RepID=UPI0032D9132F